MPERFRIAVDRRNIGNPPWRDAVGIEDMGDGAEVPALVCWFKRGNGNLPQLVVDLLNWQQHPDA